MTKRRVWSIIGFLVALFLIAVGGEWYRGVTSLQEPPLRPELAGGADGLKTLIWTDEGGVASAARVGLWILFDNQTGGPIHELHFLTFRTPGFKKVKNCWNQDEMPICYPGSHPGKFVQSGLTPVLALKQTTLIYGELSPRHWFGRHGASGVIAWKNAQGQKFQRAVVLPGVEVHSEGMDILSGIVKALEICALPIALAILAWWLKKQQDERDRAAKSKQEAQERDAKIEQARREELARTEQARQIRLQETWNLQLPKFVKDIGDYYMPVYLAIQQLVQHSKKLNASSAQGELHGALFRLMRLNRRMAHLSEKIGGFSFKNHEGEDLAAACWALFGEANREQTSTAEEDGARIGDVIGPYVSLAQFMDLINGSPETKLSRLQGQRIAEGLENLTGCMREWTKEGKLQADLVPLEILSYILSFEMNRPLELWYGRLPGFPGKEFGKTVAKLPEGGLKAALHSYQAACEGEVQRSLASAGQRMLTPTEAVQPQGSSAAAI
jgi:hypothetical protein